MKVLITVKLLVVGVAVAGNAVAEDGFRVPEMGTFGIAPAPTKLIDEQPRSAKATMPLEAVLDTIKHRLPGRALGARMIEWEGREAYEIRWIGDDGVVRDITADAVSGRILDER